MNFFNKKVLFFVGVGVFFFLAIFLFLLESTGPKTEPPAYPTPTPYKTRLNPAPSSSYSFSQFQKTTIGKTSDKEIASLATIIGQKTSSDGTTTYSVKSVNPLKPDEVITQKGVVVYEKTSVFTSGSGGFPKISSYRETFGQPDAEIKGSLYFGDLAVYYVYSSKGFSLIGNPFTDEVYEIQRFIPLSTNDYKEKYGSDIKTSSPKENL